MEMLLMGIVLSLLGVVVSAGLFAAATHGADEKMAADALEPIAETVPARFFAPAPLPARGALARPPVSVDVLLLRIERHVRMEQAAAESFMARPTAEMLHMPTASPLVH